MATKSSINPEMINKGFFIDTEDDLFPRIKPATAGIGGIETNDHLLFMFAMDVIYKFQCEDLDTSKFFRTRKFISAYHLNDLKRNKWFKSREMKLLQEDKFRFNKEFMFNLKAI